jgi:hypothetical protein
MNSGEYSEGTHEASRPLELEETTTPPARPPQASEAVKGLTLAEAASAYGLSVSSVRRLITKGKLIGAVKVPTPKGASYRIPPEALEALGYEMKATQSGAILTAARANLEAEELSRKVKELEASLEVESLRRQLAEERERLKDEQIEDLRLFTETLRTALDKMPKQIERRGLFRRVK